MQEGRGRAGDGGLPPGVRPMFPSADEDELPPSGRHYRRPVPPRQARRSWGAALLVAAAVLAGVGAVLLIRGAAGPGEERLSDPVARVSYAVPDGWTRGAEASTTSFTSGISLDERREDGSIAAAAVLVGPWDGPGDPPEEGESLRRAAAEVSERYAALFLHARPLRPGEEGPLTIGGRPAYSREVGAVYDELTPPAYLRAVVVLARDGRAVMIVGLAQPDGDDRRAAIDAVVRGLRLG
ncbi:hypothetical protein [Bailinhaonella thermotolerans]|uniref:Uncharacterized protein n=1 Tax=Bailinhaonella thermotolerans TaxID=1070861 RepID=A0A3A4AYV4_9ACTN|nr:hypothetical protein [Bailinhaonella thermotolerans]RJL24542.1 hypothetical protein D5H75_29980 [Bailinhaonella thermotolerans]